MTLKDFRQSLTATEPPPGLTLPSPAYGGIPKAIGSEPTNRLSRTKARKVRGVHAYLHRKEGDQSNAAYWYSRAGKPVSREPLDAEWLSIVGALLE